MNRARTFPTIITALLVAAGSAAWCSVDDTGASRLSVDGGLAIPTSVNDFSTSQKMGPVVGLQYLYGLDQNWGIGLQGDYFHLPAKDHVINSPEGGSLNAQSKDDAATVEFVARYILLPDAKVEPYLLSGVGVNYFHQVTQGQPTAGSDWTDTGTDEPRSVQDTKSLGFAYSAGFGFETSLSRSFVLGLEAAWQIFGVSAATYGTNALNLPTVTLRLGWRFNLPETAQQ